MRHVERLADMVVHAGLQAGSPVRIHRVGGHGYHRQLKQHSSVGANQQVQRFLPIVVQLDLRNFTVQQLKRDLLIDKIIFRT